MRHLIALPVCVIAIQACLPSSYSKAEKGDRVTSQIDTATVALRAKRYLEAFGYMGTEGSGSSPSTKIQNAILKFQKFAKVRTSGVLDNETLAAMIVRRCGEKDVQQKGEQSIWHKTMLSWNVSSYPTTLSKMETRQVIDAAVNTWEKQLPISFVEIGDASRADVLVSFIEPSSTSTGSSLSSSGLTVVKASGPVKSQIKLNRKVQWTVGKPSTSDSLEMSTVMLHALGHTLGLVHSSSPTAIMNPFFGPTKRSRAGFPELTTNDINAARYLYGLPSIEGADEDGDTDILTAGQDCPTNIEAATEVGGRVYLFGNGKVWQLQDRQVEGASQPISQVFPKGPPNVNASVTRDELTVLIHEKTLYGYDFDEGTHTFRLANGWPKMLNNLVLFFPQGAFPLANGSVILLSNGNAFATYNLDSNQPSMLNDKEVFFPNLPESVRAGVPLHGTSNAYRLFTKDTVYEYSMQIQQITAAQPLRTYISCT